MRLHNRQIKASFWTDTGLIQHLTREQRMFYVGLWQLADDSGCLFDDPFAFKINYFEMLILRRRSFESGGTDL